MHAGTDDGTRAAAVDRLLAMQPEIAGDIKTTLSRPPPPEPAESGVFVSVPEWERRIAERDAIIADYRKTIGQQQREIVKLRGELARLSRDDGKVAA